MARKMGTLVPRGGEMTTGYEMRYSGLTPKQCKREAMLLMLEAINGSRTWEDVTDRLVTLKRVASYAPCPVDDCKVVWREAAQ